MIFSLRFKVYKFKMKRFDEIELRIFHTKIKCENYKIMLDVLIIGTLTYGLKYLSFEPVLLFFSQYDIFFVKNKKNAPILFLKMSTIQKNFNCIRCLA